MAPQATLVLALFVASGAVRKSQQDVVQSLASSAAVGTAAYVNNTFQDALVVNTTVRQDAPLAEEPRATVVQHASLMDTSTEGAEAGVAPVNRVGWKNRKLEYEQKLWQYCEALRQWAYQKLGGNSQATMAGWPGGPGPTAVQDEEPFPQPQAGTLSWVVPDACLPGGWEVEQQWHSQGLGIMGGAFYVNKQMRGKTTDIVEVFRPDYEALLRFEARQSQHLAQGPPHAQHAQAYGFQNPDWFRPPDLNARMVQSQNMMNQAQHNRQRGRVQGTM